MDKRIVVICLIGLLCSLIFINGCELVMKDSPEKSKCKEDCAKLGLHYFHYENNAIAARECWCKINNETKQIW